MMLYGSQTANSTCMNVQIIDAPKCKLQEVGKA
jgi:hypothetical protein